MKFARKKWLGLFVLIPFLLSGFSFAAAEEGEAEGTAETAAEESPAVGGESTGKGFYQKYVKPTDYAISRAFMKISPLESPIITNFRLFGNQIDAITEAVPGLEIMGMIRNRTWVNTHGRSGYTSGGGDLRGRSYEILRDDPTNPDAGLRFPKSAALANKGRRNSQFNMIEWLAELEMRYSLNPNLSLATTLNYRYDSLYDWDKRVMRGFDRPFPDEVRRFGIATATSNGRMRRRFMKEVEKESAYYRDTKQILREAYLDAIFPSQENGTLSFRLGKQQVGLGKQDFNVVDVINQQWSTAGPSSIPANLEWDRLPTWMANVSYSFPERILPGVALRFLWIPDFEPTYPGSARTGAPNWGRGRPPVQEDLTVPSNYYGTLTVNGKATGVGPLITVDDPTDWSFGGSEWAVNLEVAGPLSGREWLPVLGNGWQTGLWWLSDFEGGATTFRRGSICSKVTGTAPNQTIVPCSTAADFANPARWLIGREAKFTRKEHFMWGTDKNFYAAGRYWLFKWEQNFTFGNPLTDAREGSDPVALARTVLGRGVRTATEFSRLPANERAQMNALAIRNRQTEDGLKKTNLMATGVTISTKFLTDLDFTVIYIDGRTFNRPLKSGVRKLASSTLLWILRYPLEGTEDRLVPGVTTYVNLVGPASWRQNFNVNYDLGENTKLYFDYNWFSGDSDSTYGGFDDWDQVRFGVTHRF